MAQTEGAQDLESGVLASHWLGPESEELTLKSGLLAIRGALGDRGLLDFPRRPNGTPLVVRQGFFERLLKGEATLQNVAAADASAAEPDVKKLGLQQLLAIRCQSLDYHPTGKDLDPKRSFLVLVDQCIMPLLGQRLLGEETKAFSEAHRAIVMRQVVLIYGANRNLIEKGVILGSDWWLLAVGGTRRYLHLGRCEVTGTTPSGAACCYRSYTARNPRDPRHSRILRWQVLLVEEPGNWTEDPLATEQRTSKTARLTAAKPGGVKQSSPATGAGSSPAAAAPAGGSGFTLFGDFDVEELFDDLEDTTSGAGGDSGSPGGDAKAPPAQSDDIDDFFDSLLDGLDAPAPGAGGAPLSQAAGSASAAAGGAAQAPPRPAAAGAEFAPPARGAGSLSEGGALGGSASTPAAASAPAAASSPAAGAEGASAAAAAGAADGAAAEEPPLTPEEERVRSALVRFYKSRSTDKLGNVDRIARRYRGDNVVDLWAALGIKYSLPPPTAVMWLSRTLGVQSVVQWPKGAVPQSARQALQRLEAPEAPSGGEAAAAGSSPPTRAALLRAALEEGDLDAAGALAFREGCPEDGLRPWLWRAFIGRESSSSGKGARDDEAPKRRAAYAELRAQAPEGDAGRLRAEIEADARAVWRGEQFSGRPEVVDAVVALAMTQAQQCERYVRGTCEIAVLLLFAMSGGGTGSVADAQADAFWCLSRLLSEVQDSISDDSTLAEQARRAHELLRVYDPPLADLLSSHGLNALPTLRLGAVLFTRCGLTLVACVRLWDTLLADPARFAFCDCAVVAMLLLRRGDLLQRSSISGLAEMLLEIPSKADVGALVDTACAICAFERRKGLDYPPRPLEEADSGAYAAAALDQAMSAAQTRLTSIWGKVRAAGAEAAAQAPAWAQQARATAKEVAASAAVVAASAADQAAAAASAGIDQAAAAASAAMEAYERTHKEGAEGQPQQGPQPGAAGAAAAAAVQAAERAEGGGAAAGEPAEAAAAAAARGSEPEGAPPLLVEAPK